jgi:ribosomal protein L40E
MAAICVRCLLQPPHAAGCRRSTKHSGVFNVTRASI